MLLEDRDPQRMSMERQAEEWIRIRPPTEEQMPDNDTAPGHPGEAEGHAGSLSDAESRIACDWKLIFERG